MTKFLTILMALGLMLGLVSHAAAVQPLNMIVMGEDNDADSVPRTHRVFNRVQRAIMESLNIEGYQVYDETAVSMDVTDTSRIGRSDAELIDVARTLTSPPMDVLTIFQIFASAPKSAVSDIRKLQVRISGRMLNVQSGQSIASFEVQAQGLPALPPGCDADCVIERAGDEASLIAEDVTAVLKEKLEAFVGSAPAAAPASDDTALTDAPAATGNGASADCPGLPTAYTIKLKNFSDEEVSQLEAYFSAFSCFSSIRPTRQSASLTEYWYETRADQLRLTRNLKGVEQAMDVSFQPQFSGNVITLTRIKTR